MKRLPFRYGGKGGITLTTRLRNRPLLKTILALGSSAIFGRVMGTVYRVALVRAAGQDAIGLVQLALPVYRIARSIATLGLPIAIAKSTAERSALQNKPELSAYRLGLILMLRASLIGFLVQALFSNTWARIVLTDERTEPALVVLAALLIPIAVTSAMRGAVQGLQRQNYLAVCDIVEVLVRIPITLGLVQLALPRGPAWAAAAVAVGFIAGELGSLVVLQMGLGYRPSVQSGQRNMPKRPYRKLEPIHAAKLLKLGIPLMCTGLLNNLMSLLTVALIPRLLQAAGLTLAEATRSYGRLSGMAVPTLYMPMMLIFPVTQVALPEITRLAAQTGGSGRRRIMHLLRKAGSGTLLVTVTVAPLLWWQANWIAGILYGDPTVGALISPLAVAAPFAFFGALAASVLYGLGMTTWTMISSMAGNMLRLVLVYLLVGRPEWGIMGALWAFIGDYILTSLLQMAGMAWALKRLQ